MNIAKCISLTQKAGLLVAVRRNLGASAVLANAAVKSTDTIKQLFVQKLRDYDAKKKQSGGKLVDSTPVFQQKLAEDLERVDRVFGVEGSPEEFLKFPTFEFKDQNMPPFNVEYKEDLTFDVKIPVVTVKSDPDKAYFDHLL